MSTRDFHIHLTELTGPDRRLGSRLDRRCRRPDE